MNTILIVLIAVVSIVLILIVLIQNPKGGGINSEFGSAVQLGGAKRATDILEKGTWGLALAIAVLCLILSISYKPSDTSLENDDVAPIETSSDFAG